MNRIQTALAIVVVSTATTFAQQTLPQPVVDVNGPHIILNNGAPRNWNSASIEVNGYWEYHVVGAPATKSLCVNAVAFVPVARVRAGGDYRGIHYDPATMNVKTVTVTFTGSRPQSLRVTKGLIQPLTKREEELQCIGSAPK